MGEIKCRCCGGMFADTEAKCPYCDTIFEAGAENQYKENLEDLRSNLGKVDDLAENTVKDDIKAFFQMFVPAVVVVFVISLISISSAKKATTGEISTRRAKMDKAIEKIVNSREYFARWEELYYQGKYEEMVESFEADRDKVLSVSGTWDFYYFVDTYSMGMTAKKKINEVAELMEVGGIISYYPRASALEDTFEYKYYLRNLDRQKNPPYDTQILFDMWDEIRTLCIETLDMTEDEFETVMAGAMADGYPSYSYCSDYVNERWGDK